MPRRPRHALHVGGTAAGQSAIDHLRRHKRQMDRVEMAIELQGSPRPARCEAHRHRGRFWMSTDGPFHAEAIGRQQVGKAIGDGRPRRCGAGTATSFSAVASKRERWIAWRTRSARVVFMRGLYSRRLGYLEGGYPGDGTHRADGTHGAMRAPRRAFGGDPCGCVRPMRPIRPMRPLRAFRTRNLLLEEPSCDKFLGKRPNDRIAVFAMSPGGQPNRPSGPSSR